MKKPPTPAISLPDEREVRGYVIRRLPLGAYLKAAQSLKDLPDAVMSALYPNDDAGTAFVKLRHLTPESAVGVLARGMSALPKPFARVISLLTGVSEHALMSDPAIGLDGLVEMLNAVIEVNHLENFTTAARETLARLKGSATTGCNA